jgi:hypothetical protein
VALVGLAAGFAGLGALGVPSSADPIGSARANAVALSQRVLQEAQLVHQRTVQYQADSARADLVREQLSGSEATARELQLRATQTESLLRQEALLSYTDAVPEVGAGGQSSSDLVEVTDQTTYLALTVGDISGTLKLLQTEQSQLAGTVTASRRELASALEAESSAGTARQLALSEAASLQVLLSRAQSQVAALSAAERPPTGPPVGDGIVKAVAQQLGAAPATSPAKGTGGPSTPGATVTSPKAATVFRASPSSTAAPAGAATTLSISRGTRATTTLDLATTTDPRTTTTLRPLAANGRLPTTTAAASRPTATTTTTTPAPRTPTPTSTTTTSATSSASPTAPPSTATSAAAPSTTTTTDPPPPTTAPPTTPPQPATAPPATTTAITVDLHPPPAGGLWLELRDCESGDNYQANTGNGYYGAYQFSWPTWVDLGYPGRPDQEPYWMQDQAAQRLEAMDGWNQWPSCSAALGV